jgi:hypothetical protein
MILNLAPRSAVFPRRPGGQAAHERANWIIAARIQAPASGDQDRAMPSSANPAKSGSTLLVWLSGFNI